MADTFHGGSLQQGIGDMAGLGRDEEVYSYASLLRPLLALLVALLLPPDQIWIPPRAVLETMLHGEVKQHSGAPRGVGTILCLGLLRLALVDQIGHPPDRGY